MRLPTAMVNALGRSRLVGPGLATGALAFFAGGFFPGVTATAAVLAAIGVVLRLTLADRPFEGWSAGLSIAAGSLALLAVWTLGSSQWSGAPARALVEFDRALLYLAVLVLFGLFAARSSDLATLLRWVAGVVCLVCVVALASRLLPATFPTDGVFGNDRLAFPLTYWNAMGMFATLGLILALNVAASAREPAVARVLAAAAFPAVAVTLYFTFSRGGIAVAVVGLASYIVLAHPRGLVSALLAIVPATLYAVDRAYGADLLATSEFAAPAAASQRHDVVVAVLAAMALAAAIRAAGLLLDRRIANIRLARRPRPAVVLAGSAVLVVAVVAGALASGLPERLDQEWRQFARQVDRPDGADLRDRLTWSGNNGRIAHWRVALDGFAEEPIHGSGAGTYRLLWERERPSPPVKVTDAHSLYLEVASELGWPGLLLLCLALGTPVAVALTRLRRPERHAAGAFVAAGGGLLLHAGIDWDWEMPALFAWFFAASGVVLAARDRPETTAPRRLTRLLAGLACLGLLLTPALVLSSQASLDRAVGAFKEGDCRTAVDASLDSLDRLRVQSEPFEIVGYCDARVGQNELAVRAFEAARSRDPDNWQYAYGLAVTQALAGRDPTAAAAEARRLNPLSPLARDLQRGLRSRSAERRRRVAGRALIPFE
ncbi:MAG TPA: O-antigen ligase family protein [Solirubrobacteraceae bacterium]|nr:O-antigen ligase family protein [Solirubrobacteraceae bacterium]